MKKEIESSKLSLRQHPFTGIRIVLCFILLIGAIPPSFAHDGDNRSKDKFYLSLGDSLSVGVQPDAAGVNQRTDDGYPDQLFNILSEEEKNLRLVKLGCENRETTENMISGGGCFYEKGSQLAQAVKFLRKHRDDVALITIDIGVNDVIFSGCIIETDGIVTGVDVGCILDPDGGPFAQVAANLPIILSTLQQAAGDDTPIVALNYYNTFLASWLTGTDGQVLAEQSALLASILNNDVLGQTYAAFSIPVADVAGAFDSDNFTDVVPFPTPGSPYMIPQNVALICLWTYMCVPEPVGPNIHANPTGYGVIAATIEQVLPADGNDHYRNDHKHNDHKHDDRHHDRHDN
ncbi:MAG: SGNH/GDSL hydrolase family protein [Gammaproteobacteria bacterium]